MQLALDRGLLGNRQAAYRFLWTDARGPAAVIGERERRTHKSRCDQEYPESLPHTSPLLFGSGSSEPCFG